MNVLKIGIIGAGRIGKLHVDNLQLMPQVKIKAVSDVVINHLEKWAQDKGISTLTTNYQDLLAIQKLMLSLFVHQQIYMRKLLKKRLLRKTYFLRKAC